MHPLRNEIRALRARRDAVVSNRELSQVGQARAVASIDAELSAWPGRAAAALQAEARLLSGRAESIAVRRAAARDVEAKRWDYQRLTYERARWTDAIAKLPAGELERRYSESDSHARLALAELAEAVAGRHGLGAGQLVSRLKSDAAELRTTPELQALDAEAADVRAAALDVGYTASVFAPEFDSAIRTGPSFGVIAGDLQELAGQLGPAEPERWPV